MVDDINTDLWLVDRSPAGSRSAEPGSSRQSSPGSHHLTHGSSFLWWVNTQLWLVNQCQSLTLIGWQVTSCQVCSELWVRVWGLGQVWAPWSSPPWHQITPTPTPQDHLSLTVEAAAQDQVTLNNFFTIIKWKIFINIILVVQVEGLHPRLSHLPYLWLLQAPHHHRMVQFSSVLGDLIWDARVEPSSWEQTTFKSPCHEASSTTTRYPLYQTSVHEGDSMICYYVELILKHPHYQQSQQRDHPDHGPGILENIW